MSQKIIENKAKELLIPIIEKAGYEVVELKYSTKGKLTYLEIFIYKKDGVSLNDCIFVNDLLDPILEEYDITNGASYSLNISSPGLDRSIITNDDFRRNLDVEIEIFLKPMKKKKIKHIGFLRFYDDDKIEIENKGIKTKIMRIDVLLVRPYININRIK
ncbi:MAG: ribosome maturation factor RimP [Christensenellales bacterium]|nr:ribosome maturation factor RimP [Clostridiales bacterium]